MDHSGWSFALGAGRRLVLDGAGRGPLWLGLGLVALTLLFVLYRTERRIVPMRTGLALLGLRLAVAMALVASLFEPAAEHTWTETVRGRVIVGVDLSDSMATTDPGRSPAHREALRRTLRLSPGDDPTALSRFEVARRLLQAPWLREIQRNHDVELIGFAREAEVTRLDPLETRLKSPPAPSMATAATDWEPVLARALAAPENGAPTVGVVLLTDGRQNGPAPAYPSTDRLRERAIPVFPILIGSTTPPRDAAIAAIVAPETAQVGQSARVDVTVKLDGLPDDQEIPVTLERPGAPPMRQLARPQPDGGRPVLRFRVPFEAVGDHDLTVTVGPIPGDARPDNDRDTRTITVVDDHARVLLVDAEPRWEFRYLRNALARDPRVTLEAVVLRQPPTPDGGAPAYPMELPPAPPVASDEPDALSGFDLIVLGDLAPADLSPADWERIERNVTERGGTLVLSAGARGTAALAASEPMGSLFPVQSPHPLEIAPKLSDENRPALPPGAVVTPTAEADDWPMFQFADDPKASRDAWARLPRLPFVLTGAPRPAATVLAVATLDRDDPADPSRDQSTSAAIAAMPYGLGKTLWVGTDATWRWRFRMGDTYHHRFWGQVVQWAKQDSLTAGNRLVQFGATPPRITEGTPATIRARFAEDLPGVDTSLLVVAKIHRRASGAPDESPSEPLSVVPLRPRADGPRQFEAVAPTLPPGTYSVRLEVPQLDSLLRDEGPLPDASLVVRPRETPERINLTASRAPLEALAAATGGRVLDDANPAPLPDWLNARQSRRQRVEPTPLWDRPESLLLLFGLLSAEWILRKRAGLP